MVKNVLMAVLALCLGGGLAYFFHLISQRKKAHHEYERSLNEFREAVDAKGWKEWDKAVAKIYENLYLEVALGKKIGWAAVLVLVLAVCLWAVYNAIP